MPLYLLFPVVYAAVGVSGGQKSWKGKGIRARDRARGRRELKGEEEGRIWAGESAWGAPKFPLPLPLLTPATQVILPSSLTLCSKCRVRLDWLIKRLLCG